MRNQKYYSLVTNNGDRTADLYIFGYISDAFNTGIDEALEWDLGEVSGLSIAKDLQCLDADILNVHINSLGGYTSEGLAILNLLKSCKQKVITYCDGFACSAASLIFMAGEERIMGAASALMIHNAWITTDGNAAQLRQQADVLEKISKAAGNAYMEHVNISREELDAMLDGVDHEGSWILPEEAVQMGFATKIADSTESSVANQSAAGMILSKLKVHPESGTPAPAIDADALAEKIANLLAPTLSTPREPGKAKPKYEIKNFLTALAKR